MNKGSASVFSSVNLRRKPRMSRASRKSEIQNTYSIDGSVLVQFPVSHDKSYRNTAPPVPSIPQVLPTPLAAQAVSVPPEQQVAIEPVALAQPPAPATRPPTPDLVQSKPSEESHETSSTGIETPYESPASSLSELPPQLPDLRRLSVMDDSLFTAKRRQSSIVEATKFEGLSSAQAAHAHLQALNKLRVAHNTETRALNTATDLYQRAHTFRVTAISRSMDCLRRELAEHKMALEVYKSENDQLRKERDTARRLILENRALNILQNEVNYLRAEREDLRTAVLRLQSEVTGYADAVGESDARCYRLVKKNNHYLAERVKYPTDPSPPPVLSRA